MADRTTLLSELDRIFMTILKRIARWKASNTVSLSPALDAVLMTVSQHHRATIKQLSQTLAVTSAAATQHVAALEEAGMVTRTPNASDRRETLVLLTDKGAETVKTIHRYRQQLVHQLFVNLQDTDLTTLISLLNKAGYGADTKEQTI